MSQYIGERLLARMMGLYGLKEIPGDQSNAELLELIRSVVPWADDDSTIAWCAILGTYLFKQEGLEDLIPDKPLAARSWLNVQGETIWEEGDDPEQISQLAKPGDLVIFWRVSRDGWQGHWALYLNQYHYDKNKTRVIGGNQSNGVLIRPYPNYQILKIIRVCTVQ